MASLEDQLTPSETPEIEEPVDHDKEDLVEALTSGYQPRAAREEVAGFVGEVEDRAGEGQAQLRQQTTAHQVEIAGAANSRCAEIGAQVTGAIGATNAAFAKARGSVEAAITGTKGRVQDQLTQKGAQLEAVTAGEVQTAGAGVSQKQNEFRAATDQEANRPQAISQTHGSRAQQEIGAGASEAERAARTVSGRYSGGDEKAQDQRKAAQQVGRDTAADIRKKGPEAARETISGTGELKGKHRELITQVQGRMTQFLSGITAGIQQMAAQSRPSLARASQSTLAALDNLRRSNLGSLERARGLAITRIRAAGKAAQSQMRQSARAQSSELGQIGRAGGVAVESAAKQTRESLVPLVEPNPRGAREVADSASASMEGIETPSKETMAGMATSAKATFGVGVQALGRQLKEQSAATLVSSQGVANNAKTSAAQAAVDHAASLEQVVSHTATQQQGLVTSGVAEVGNAGRTSLDEMRGKNSQLDTETAKATNESISKSTEPAGQVSDRANQAATQAGEEHEKSLFGKIVSGIWSAIKTIAVGLVILLAVAVVLVALAALAGFTLGLGAAMLIAGAGLLIYGGVQAYRARSQAHPDAGTGSLLWMTFKDVTGITGVQEAVTGKDSFTGQELDAEERARRGTLGGVTLLLTAVGIRSAGRGLGGPRGSPLIPRPTRFPQGMGAGARLLAALKAMGTGLSKSRVGKVAEGLKSAPGRVVAWLKSKLEKSSEQQKPKGVSLGEPPKPKVSPGPPKGMSPSQQALWRSFTSPKARAQLEAMFERLGSDPNKLQAVLDKMKAKPDETLEQRFEDDWANANPTPPSAKVLAKLDEQLTRAQQLLNDINAKQDVKGVGELKKAVNGEIRVINGLKGDGMKATPERIDGVKANLDGVEGNLRAANEATNVTQVGGKFKTASGELKDVDVVADRGRTWIESKAEKPFGIDSGQPPGSHLAKMKDQARGLLEAADNNRVDGVPPKVVFRFDKGVTPEVAAELRGIGVEVLGYEIVITGPRLVPVPVYPPEKEER